MDRKLIAALVANLFAAGFAPAAHAQEEEFQLTGEASLGGMRVDDHHAKDASKLTEYQDLSTGLITAFDAKGRGGRFWLDLFGENLGRDDQYLQARGGMYDTFKYRLYSDALRHNFLLNGVTPYAGAGSATQTATFPRLDPLGWNSLDIGYRRRDDGFVFELQSLSPWYLRADANQVTWKGTKPGASSQGMSPGNGFVDLSLPVDYRTRNATFEGGYNVKAMHFDLSWMTSRFDNANDSVAWTNGFWGNGTDRTYLAPDNQYSRLAGNATWRKLPWNSTLAARFTSDELRSNATLGTSVLNGAAGQVSPTGPSAATFDGNVKTRTFTLAWAAAPAKPLDLRAYYNYRKRDDDSTRVDFNSTAIPGPIDNELFSYDKSNFGADAHYRIGRHNRVGGGFDYLDTKREGRFDYDRTRDRRWFVEWKNSSLDELGVRAKYSRLERDSDFLLAGDGTGASDPAYLNRFVTAFDLSNVKQDQWKLTLDYSPIDFLDVSLEAIAKDNKFRDNVLGRLKDRRSEIYASVSYGAPGAARLTVFGDSEDIKYESTHRIIGAGTAPGANDPGSAPTAANYDWSGTIKDRNWAFGLSLDVPIGARVMLKASAIYYKTDGTVDLALQEGVPASVARPVPVAAWDDSKRTSLNLKAVYSHSKAWSFTGGFAYEKYEYNDAQYDGYRNTIPAANRADSYLDGVYSRAQYKAGIVYALATCRF